VSLLILANPSLLANKKHKEGRGPNPWKVAIVLEELSIPYTMNYIGNPASQFTHFFSTL